MHEISLPPLLQKPGVVAFRTALRVGERWPSAAASLHRSTSRYSQNLRHAYATFWRKSQQQMARLGVSYPQAQAPNNADRRAPPWTATYDIRVA